MDFTYEMRSTIKNYHDLDDEALFPIVKELFKRGLPPIYTQHGDFHYYTSYKMLGDLAERIYRWGRGGKIIQQ